MGEHSIKLYTKDEVAKALRCCNKTIERRMKAGLIVPVEGTGGKHGRLLFDPMSIPALKRLIHG